jgi:hypothetical protein
MTSQTKHYIELSDIVAIRIECGGCHASTSLPIADNLKTNAIKVCPHCNEQWAQLIQGANLEQRFKDLAHILVDFKNAVRMIKEHDKEYKASVSLELTADALPSGRASHEKN